MGNARELLTAQMESVSDDIREYVRQIESGEYIDGSQRSRDKFYGACGVEGCSECHPLFDEDNDILADEPTVNETPISEYPLEVVDERGRQFAVVISTGGPHIEVTADGGQRAFLVGYWGGEKVTRSGDHFDTFLDHFIYRD